MDNVDICMITLLVCLLVYWTMWFKINCGRKLKGVERKDLPKELISRKKMTYDRLALSHHLKDVSQQLASSPKPLIAREFRFQGNFNSDLKAYTEMDSKKKDADKMDRIKETSPRSEYNSWRRLARMNEDEGKINRFKETTPRSDHDSWRRRRRMNEDADKMDRIKETSPRSEYNSWRRLARMNEDEDKMNRFKETTARSDHDSWTMRRRMNEDEDKMNRFKETTPRSDHDSWRRRRRMNEDDDKMNRFKETTPRSDHDSWRRRRRIHEDRKDSANENASQVKNRRRPKYSSAQDVDLFQHQKDAIHCSGQVYEPIQPVIVEIAQPVHAAAFIYLPPPPPDPPNPP